MIWLDRFRDLTHRFLFRPLAARWDARCALLAGFLFSGFVHDLVISWPAGAGYGGPTIYFVVQALALLLERSRVGRFAGLARGIRGRLFAWVVILLPAPLLFHPPVVSRVVLPFLHSIGAL